MRRLIENGANSSFVATAADPSMPVETLLRRPADIIGSADNAAACEDSAAARSFPAGARQFARHRVRRARGAETGWSPAIAAEHASIVRAMSTISDAGRRRTVPMPTARSGFSSAGAAHRRHVRAARPLERAADLLEQRSRALHRAAATRRRQDAGRCAVAKCAKPSISAATTPPKAASCSATAQTAARARPARRNALRLRGRGVFVAISPWNFPLAIFIGQVTAALMAGNTVVAKPAEQTPLIAAEAVRLLHRGRIPEAALHLVQGDGHIGAALVAHRDIAGVVFTGSTEVARSINRALAAKDGPIVPLIAETGGINAMIADATALPEQVADDVVTSAFRSAGQRCSALRLLFVQEDVADRMIEMIAGAARELEDRRSARSRHPCRPGDRRARQRIGSMRISRA